MSVTPTAHAASHGSGGNDAITTLGAVTIGAATTGDLNTGSITMTEQTAPSSPAANKGVLYLRDVAGVTTLSIKFANGQVIDICDDTP